MPTYEFRHKDTGEVIEKILTISEREQWLEDNPDWQSKIGAPRLVTQVGSTISKAPDSWKDLLGRIKKGSGKDNTINT